jgi:hypothetical protein
MWWSKSNSVTIRMTSKVSRQIGKVAAAGLMLTLWLGLFALAAIPQLHQLLHQDAQNLNHQCLVTQIQQHSLLAGAAPAIAPILPADSFPVLARNEFQFLSFTDHRLTPSRGPPTAIPSLPVVG